MISIAHPLVDSNTKKRIQKLIKELNKENLVFRGLKHTLKKIKEGNEGIVILSAETAPVDLIIHYPAMCEEKKIPYCFVERDEDLSLVEITTCCYIQIKHEDERVKKILDKINVVKI